MKINYSLLLYRKRKDYLGVKILKYFSFWGLWMTLMSAIKMMADEKELHKIIITTRFLPLQRYEVVSRMNAILLTLFLKLIFNHASVYDVVWINDPDFYSVHNFLRWNYLVFDYEKNYYKRHSFYNEVFRKQLVYFYKILNKPELFWVKKDSEFKYEAQIWRQINS